MAINELWAYKREVSRLVTSYQIATQDVFNPFTTKPLAIFLELETDNLGVID